jgi:hypothetical protein
MTTNPTIGRLLKGALVTVDVQSKTTQATIAFQYNPDRLTRSLTPVAGDLYNDEQNKRIVALRYKGAPRETISIAIEIDAIDKLGSSDTSQLESGIYPQLAALEMLVYPQSQQVTQVDGLAKQGQSEIVSGYDAPLTLFVWGPKRVLPVRLTRYDITEQEFDSNLNPIRAVITLAMDVLTYSDLAPSHPGYNLFLAHQKNKEHLARQGQTSDASVLGVDVAARLR